MTMTTQQMIDLIDSGQPVGAKAFRKISAKLKSLSTLEAEIDRYFEEARRWQGRATHALKRNNEMLAVLIECIEYLDKNSKNSICATSRLHKRMREAAYGR